MEDAGFGVQQDHEVRAAVVFEVLELMELGHYGIWDATDDPEFGVLWDVGCRG